MKSNAWPVVIATFIALLSVCGSGSSGGYSSSASTTTAGTSLAHYRSASGDTTWVAGQRSQVGPSRTAETYFASKGYATDVDSLAALLCTQSRFNWLPDLRAAAINDYIRAGFVRS